MSENSETGRGLAFEMVCLDNTGEVRPRTEGALLSALMSDSGLFREADPATGGDGVAVSRDGKVRVEVSRIDTSNMAFDSISNGVAFTVRATSSDGEALGAFKQGLASLMASIHFPSVWVTRDDHSKMVTTRLYGRIHDVETKAREFIINFFARSLGVDWPRVAIPKAIRGKAAGLAERDEAFIVWGGPGARAVGKPRPVKNHLVRKDLAFSNFSDLGTILSRENAAIFNARGIASVEDLRKKILDADDINVLKREALEGTFYQYIDKFFEKEGFSAKWGELYRYRNKVAHNNLITNEEEARCDVLLGEIEAILDKASEGWDTFRLSASGEEDVIDAIGGGEVPDVASPVLPSQGDPAPAGISKVAASVDASVPTRPAPMVPTLPTLPNPGTALRLKAITEDEFIDYFKREKALGRSFIGLRHFIVDILGAYGFEYNASFIRARNLVAKNVLKIGEVDNPYGDTPVSTLDYADPGREAGENLTDGDWEAEGTPAGEVERP